MKTSPVRGVSPMSENPSSVASLTMRWNKGRGIETFASSFFV